MSELFRRIIYSGTCTCGHSWEDHHLSAVVAPEAIPIMGSWLPQECEFYGRNEDGGLDADGNDHCHNYVDTDNSGELRQMRFSYPADEQGEEE